MFAKLSLAIYRSDPFYDQTRDEIGESDVYIWIKIEANQQVSEVLIDDSLNESKEVHNTVI